MYDCYRSIARTCFPNSVCIVDHFHLSQELGRRIDSVRIRTMKKYSGNRKSDEYYLLKKFNWMIFKSDINSEPVMDPNAERKWNGHFRKYMNLYEIKDLLFGIDPQLQEAWNMKDSIVDFYSTATIENAGEKLNRIIEEFDDSSVTEMNAFAKTLKKWRKEIINSFHIVGYEYQIDQSTGHVAAQEKKMVILHNYESVNSNVVRDRLVEPFGFTNDFIEVWAYDTESNSNKLFKVQRIGEVEITELAWEYEISHRKQGRDIFRMTGYANSRVRMQLSVRAKNLLIEEYPLAEKEITRDGNFWILDTVVNDFAGICRYYVGLISEIKVLEGDDFLEYVRAYMKKYINKV